MSKDYADDDFKDFLDNENDGDINLSEVSIIINAIDNKMNAVSNMYSETLKAYNDINDSKLKKELKDFILILIKESKQSFQQFDYALLVNDGGDEDNE